MIRERGFVEPLLEKYPLNVVWADVCERLEEEDLLAVVSDLDGIICGDDRLTSKVYDRAAKLKVVVKWGTGIDSINKEEAEKRNISVFRTPGAFTEPVADSTLAYILAFCRNVVGNDKILKEGGWDKPKGYSLFERTVGIIGLGDIGNAVAKRLRAFGADIIAYDIAASDVSFFNPHGVRMVEKEEILFRSDFISLHCDLNDSSYQTLKAADFRRMERFPFVLNMARGALIEEKALIEALEREKIVGAALDVFEEEPLPLSSPLRNMDHVFLASHNSNSSPKCWEDVHRHSLKMLMKGLGFE